MFLSLDPIRVRMLDFFFQELVGFELIWSGANLALVSEPNWVISLMGFCFVLFFDLLLFFLAFGL